MGIRNVSGVRRLKERGRTRLVLDFWFTNHDGRRERFRRIARVQTRDGAAAEAKRLMDYAVKTGSVEEEESTLPTSVPKVREFYEGAFTKLFMPTYKPSTRRRYRDLWRQRVEARFGDLALDSIDRSCLRSFVAHLKAERVQPKGPTNFIRTILRAAEEEKLIAEAPRLPRGLIKTGKKIPGAPTREEVDAYLAHAKAGDWLRPAIALGAFAGLRQGEVRALEVGDIDFERGLILVRRALSEDEVLTTKSEDEREVDLLPELADILREAVANKLPRARLILTRTGSTPTRQSVLARLKYLQRRHGMKARSFHQLRHFFCSELDRTGAGAETIKTLAGHSSITVTERYLHSHDRDRREAVMRLSR